MKIGAAFLYKYTSTSLCPYLPLINSFYNRAKQCQGIMLDGTKSYQIVPNHTKTIQNDEKSTVSLFS